MTNDKPAQLVMQRIEELAQISDESGRLTRTFCSPAMRKAHDLAGSWMREAGMTVSEDAIGNLIGRYPGRNEHAKTFILGSHLDTVRGAGKFDGTLGVLTAIACVQHLHEQKMLLPYALEVVAFAGGEGLRYGASFPGSRALAGTFKESDLKKLDSQGIAMSEAIRAFGCNPDNLERAKRDPHTLLGYAEVHIEEGPVLEMNFQPLAVVTAIAGQTEFVIRFTGQTGNAGATPMSARRDALVAAAQFIVATETVTRLYPGLLATVDRIEARPGTSHVIPGEVTLTLDVRHTSDSVRSAACARLQETANHAGQSRGITVECQLVRDAQSVPCSHDLTAILSKAARQHLVGATELTSGATHDAAAMGDITPVALLFVRCKGGISHHPDESVAVEDVETAVAVMNDFLLLLANQQNPYAATGNTAHLKRLMVPAA